MTQSERREYLIEYLLKEERKIFRQKMPSDKEGQENLLRSLMNVLEFRMNILRKEMQNAALQILQV